MAPSLCAEPAQLGALGRDDRLLGQVPGARAVLTLSPPRRPGQGQKTTAEAHAGLGVGLLAFSTAHGVFQSSSLTWTGPEGYR